MGIIRAQDPKAGDLKHEISNCLGKLVDPSISTDTKKQLMEKLTYLLNGKPFTLETFQQIGLECEIRPIVDNKELVMRIKVSSEYVSANITEDRDDQWVSFGIKKVLNISNTGSDTVYIDGTTEQSEAAE